VDAIEAVSETKEAAQEIKTEALDANLGAGYGIFAGPAHESAVLRFQPFVARWVEAERWHAKQSLKREPDGTPESWGLSQVLWAPQGDLSLSPLASSVVDSIHQSLDAQLSADGKAVENRLEDEYLKYFSPTLGKLKGGKNAVRQVALQAERDEIVEQVESAKKLLEQFEARSGDIAILREQVAGLQSQKNTLASNVEAAAASAETYKALEAKRTDRISAKALAETQQKAIRDRIAAIDRCRTQVAEFEAGIGKLDQELPQRNVELKSKQEAVALVGQKRAATVDAEREAVAAAETAKLDEEYVRLLDQANDMARRLGSIANAQLKIVAAQEKKVGILAPSEQELRELRSLVALETDCRRKLELARVTVGFVPESAVEIEVLLGEQPGQHLCQPGIPIQLAGSPNLEFVLTGVGRFEVSGPATDCASVRAELEECQKGLARFMERFQIADPDILGERRRMHQELDAEIAAETVYIELVLDGEDEANVREHHKEVVSRVEEIEQQRPDWAQAVPNAVLLTQQAEEKLFSARSEKNAADIVFAEAQKAVQEVEAGINSLNERRNHQIGTLESARKLLKDSIADGLSDAERAQTLNRAVLDYDAARLALEETQRELTAFGRNPVVTHDALQKQLGELQQKLRLEEDKLLQAETEIASLVERRPHTAYCEVSESLKCCEDDFERERRRMTALKLLRDTIIQSKSDLLANIAAPIEKAATGYLEEICAKPIAEIRLGQDFAAKGALPKGLDDPVDLDCFSGGEREQIFLATRLALAMELARKERQFVVLDDVLVSTDAARMSRVCKLLERLAERLQILILTCHPERFTELRKANRIDLRDVIDLTRRAAA
jgi:DNA repair protein SbcC/Rad50